MRQVGSSILTLAACVALFAAPVFAQSSSSAPAAPPAAPPAAAPAPAAPPAAAPAPAAPAPAAAAPKAAAPAMKVAAKPKHKFSCYDYAWQSQDMKDCLAKASAKPAAKATKGKPMKSMKGM